MTVTVTTTEGLDRHEAAFDVEMGALQDLRVVDDEGRLVAAYAPGKWISAVREEEDAPAAASDKECPYSYTLPSGATHRCVVEVGHGGLHGALAGRFPIRWNDAGMTMGAVT